jgi:hypothetical protein
MKLRDWLLKRIVKRLERIENAMDDAQAKIDAATETVRQIKVKNDAFQDKAIQAINDLKNQHPNLDTSALEAALAELDTDVTNTTLPE